MKIDIIKFKSPLPVEGPPVNCVELTIYDNDGPEGFYRRFRFKRSSDAVLLIMNSLSKKDIKDLNFQIVNYWKQQSV